MREFWGLTGQESAEAVREAIEALLAAARSGTAKRRHTPST